MNSPFRHTLLLLLLLGHGLCAQLRTDRPVILTGAADSARQVLGLPDTTAPEAVLSTATEQGGAHRFAPVTAGAIWAVTLPALPDGPAPGTQLNVQLPGDLATGPVLLSVNGGPAYHTLWMAGDTVLMQDLAPGSLLAVVFDGTNFHALNGQHHALRECPSGMVPVNGQYCVELAQRPALVMEQAALTCAALDRRLCSWAEFQAACDRRTELGILAPSVDWEWTNDGANSAQNARVVRYTSTSSHTACFSVGTRNILGPAAPYRCCFTR